VTDATSQLQSASEPVSSRPAEPPDVVGMRIGAALIDLLIMTVLAIVVSASVGRLSVTDASDGATGVGFSSELGGRGLMVFIALVLIYHFVLEAVTGRTVGKMLVGLRVTRPDGGRPSAGAIALRTVLRLLDGLPTFYLIGLITMLVSDRNQRLGDMAAKTVVTPAAPVRRRALAAVLLAVVLAGAVEVSVRFGGDKADNVYRADGATFRYPTGWQEDPPGTVQAQGEVDALWDTAFWVDDYDVVLVSAYPADPSVSSGDLSTAEPWIAAELQQVFAQMDGTLYESEQVTVAGHQALRYRADGRVNETPVESQVIVFFDGPTQYFVNCQYTPAGEAEIVGGCEEILETFELESAA
jgi:uncharacterized RDD family membrane protein YckC